MPKHELPVRSMILILSGALALSAQGSSLPTYWRYSHPEAKVLIGIDVRRLLESQFGQRLAREFEQAGLKERGEAAGLPMFLQVDRLLISAPRSAAPLKANEQPPIVLTLQGKFDLATIRAFVKTKGVRREWHQRVELLSPESSARFCLALVSPQIMLAGDTASVKAALDHYAAADATASTNPLYTQAVRLAAVHDIWFVSAASPVELSGGSAMPGPMVIFTDVESFEGGLNFRNGMGLEVILNAPSSDSARKMAMGLSALLQMAAIGEQTPDSTAEVLKKVTVVYDQTKVKMGLSLDQAELDRRIDETKLAFAKDMPKTVASAQAQPTEQPSPEQPQPREDPTPPLMIRVYNAEGGTREIRLGPK